MCLKLEVVIKSTAVREAALISNARYFASASGCLCQKIRQQFITGGRLARKGVTGSAGISREL